MVYGMHWERNLGLETCDDGKNSIPALFACGSVTSQWAGAQELQWELVTNADVSGICPWPMASETSRGRMLDGLSVGEYISSVYKAWDLILSPLRRQTAKWESQGTGTWWKPLPDCVYSSCNAKCKVTTKTLYFYLFSALEFAKKPSPASLV